MNKDFFGTYLVVPVEKERILFSSLSSRSQLSSSPKGAKDSS